MESNIVATLACVGLRVKLAVSERVSAGHKVSIQIDVARRSAYRYSHYLVVQTEAMTNSYKKYCKRVDVIQNPVYHLYLHLITERREYLTVAIGRLTPQKGYRDLLTAFTGVIDNHSDRRYVV